MAERPLPAYNGDGPYVFVTYGHEDSDVVLSEIRWLQVTNCLPGAPTV